MRTLLATYLVPFPADSGGKAVSAQTLSCLAQLGPVDVCAFEVPWGRPEGVEELRRVGRRVFTLPLRRRSPARWIPLAARGLPYYILRDHCGQMADRVAEMGRARCDLAFADSLHTAAYVSRLAVPKILQQHNVESFLIQGMLGSHRNPLVRAAGPVERRNLDAFERDQCNAFDAVIALSDTDAARLRGLGVRVPVAVIPPAVEPAEPIPEGPERRYIVHIGTGTWPPIDEGLRWYIRGVLPHIRREAPGAETLMAGPPPKDRRFLDGEGGIRALGYMEDLEPVYRAAAVFMVPLLVGGGVRLKILHALARGLAVVSTSAGCEGLGMEHGRHLLIADRPEEFAASVVALLGDIRLRSELGERGRAFVLEHFNPGRRCAQLAALARAVAVGERLGPDGLPYCHISGSMGR
jgi:glycosyltransferase involved in cell wall biosynthesis